MERLIIVIDCPDSWRQRIDPATVAESIAWRLEPDEDQLPGVRARWQSMDTDGV